MNTSIASLVHINLLIKKRMLFSHMPLSKSLEAFLNDNLIGFSGAIKLTQLLKLDNMNRLLLQHSVTLVT